jgi:hypothetical protein
MLEQRQALQLNPTSSPFAVKVGKEEFYTVFSPIIFLLMVRE